MTSRSGTGRLTWECNARLGPFPSQSGRREPFSRHSDVGHHMTRGCQRRRLVNEADEVHRHHTSCLRWAGPEAPGPSVSPLAAHKHDPSRWRDRQPRRNLSPSDWLLLISANNATTASGGLPRVGIRQGNPMEHSSMEKRHDSRHGFKMPLSQVYHKRQPPPRTVRLETHHYRTPLPPSRHPSA